MKIALLCSLVLAAVFVGEACELCSMEPEKMSATIMCMSDKMATELKDKLTALNSGGSSLQDSIKKLCDSGADLGELLKQNLNGEEMASLRKAYEECTSS